ncbi:MAG TPA: hypothetical protein DCW52_04585 [Gammaproteobacteria bacterium]|jgi:hypothetical protein|nr:hypothetical protein [Gammaproteobacteria bacterium]
MAQFSNTYDHSNNVGSGVSNREDLMDVLTILAPEETPILSSANKKKANSTYVEWTVDALSAPTTAGIGEGDDVATFTDKFSGRARLGNYVQKFRRDFMVSDLQEAVDSVGPAKIAQAEAKAIRELKRDIEATLCSGNDRAVEDGTNPYKLRGLGSWIDAGATNTDVPAAFRTPAGNIHDTGAFGETELNDIITSAFRVTGSNNSLMLVADTALRRTVSDFARVVDTGVNDMRQVNYDGGSADIKVSVDLYQSDHGIVSVVNMNPDCAPDTTNKDTGYLVSPEHIGIHELIPMGSTRLPNQGGGERGFVDCALTLGVYHPGAFGKITALA